MLVRRLVFVAMVVCSSLLAAACGRTQVGLRMPAETPQPLALPYTISPDRGDGVLELEGRLVPVDEARLTLHAPGRVKRVLVERGDRVAAGDLLIELESGELSNQIEQARLSLGAAKLARAEAERSREREVKAAKLELVIAETRLAEAAESHAAAVAQAELALAQAQEQLVRVQALQSTYSAQLDGARVGLARAQERTQRAELAHKQAMEREWESSQVRASLAREFQQAQWDLELAQAQVDEVAASQSSHQHDVKSQEIAVQQAEAELAALKAGPDLLLPLHVERARKQIEWLEERDPPAAHEVERAQLVVAQLEMQLEQTQVWAPFDGTIVELWVRPGDTVGRQQAALLLADLGRFQLHVKSLSQYDVARVSVGQPATVSLDAFPEAVLTGSVRKIALQESPLQEDAVFYALWIVLDAPLHPTARLWWGMTGVSRLTLPPVRSGGGVGE